MKTLYFLILSLLMLTFVNCEREKNILAPQNNVKGKIVYNSASDILIMQTDGSNKINLTADMVKEQHTSYKIEDVSRDGKNILFTQSYPKTSGTGAIYTTWIMDISGANKKSLNNTALQPFRPRFSADGALIVFLATDNMNDVFVMNRNSMNPGNITSDSNRDWSPNFYPNDQKIIYVSEESDRMDLYSINLDGSNRMNLTNDGALYGANYTFSYDGTKIVYSSSKSGQENIYSINPDGSNQMQITNSYGKQNPVLSFDNSMIAFVAWTIDGYDIRIIDIDGRNEKTIASTVKPAQNDYWRPIVLFTPDNKHIIFTSHNDGNDEIYKADLNGKNIQNLTNSPENEGLAKVLP